MKLFGPITGAVKEVSKAVNQRLPSLSENYTICGGSNDDNNKVLTDEEFCSLLGRVDKPDGIVYTQPGHHKSESLPDFDGDFHCLDIWD